MKFRDQEVSGFFTIHTKDCGTILTAAIKDRLVSHNADMLDVQYSTHIAYKNGKSYLVNDVLVMYTERKNELL